MANTSMRRTLPACILVASVAALMLATPSLATAQEEQRERPERVGRRANAVEMGSEGLVAPRLISMELPEYTESAQAAGVEGDVYIEAVVTTEGTVVEPELIRGIADDELDRRALEAVTRWEFEPGTKDDEPVDVIALFTVTYRIH